MSILKQVDDDLLVCRVGSGGTSPSALFGEAPFRLDGTFLMMVRGRQGFRFEVNFEEFEVSPDTLLMAFPGSVIRPVDTLPPDAEAQVIYFDTKFSRSVNISLTGVAIPSSISKPRPLMRLTSDECALLERYFRLIHDSTLAPEANVQVRRSIASSLISALFYQLILFYHNRIAGEITAGADIRVGTRRNEYVSEFVRLVHMHYVSERNVAFYADKLYISPKYLSLLVKQATGRTAANWIDEFVIMEAKNLLRFSGKNIQQVAYALNFPTQSSFGKYFKHLTGLSPSEYQKS